jgi:GH15 family glucan-1,4-alpha-glucosidase
MPIDETLTPDRHRALVRRSVESILRNQEPNGAIVASPDFAQYHFCWLRDGSFSAYALDLAGEHAASARYHGWVNAAVQRIGGVIDTAVARRERGEDLDPLKMPPARFTLQGSVVVDGWPNFQIDGYGTWLWSLGQHLLADESTRLPDVFHDSVVRVSRYLASFALSPCYDVWEESGTAVHTSTLASVYGGLIAAARLTGDSSLLDFAASVKTELETGAGRLGFFGKSSENEGVDSSALWLTSPFRVVAPSDVRLEKTVALIEERLLLDGGLRRYATDTYFGSGAWPVLTASLGWHYVATGDLAEARRCLEWITDHIEEDGLLGEQFGGQLRDPQHYLEWVDRWGPPAKDLTWSHAMFVILSSAIENSESWSHEDVAAVPRTGSRLRGGGAES